ncbi:MAG: pantoate--beta-alanine ligase [Cytophagales bacterium]|nr:pantoate--beta-alanine ligase [Bernardetiaceae bacterium]MDW8209594.1 pantoate--beta-alanine ligase [Cytophagales bacterium]
MKVYHKVSDLRAWRGSVGNLSIGLVPTMGALHAGHLSLVERSKAENQLTVCSIFVNPIQFNDAQDLKNYPRTPEEDLTLLKAAGCEVVFMPDEKEMYPAPVRMRLYFGALEEVMEGAHRPGHFNGVGIVVSKLFNIVEPTRAYFGQKDFQQYLIIKRLVEDLSYPIELVCCPIVRQADGLALSSRNMRLSPQGRKQAPALYQALQEAKQRILQGESPKQVCSHISDKLNSTGWFQVNYLTLADSQTLMEVSHPQPNSEYVLCIAASIEGVRLIDNLLFTFA